MRVVVYPSDRYGCGYHRMIWPGEMLRSQGYDVTVVPSEERELHVKIHKVTEEVSDIQLPEGTDVVVFQRMTHRIIIGMLKWCAKQRIATVIDVDDDLGSVHAANPASKSVNLRYSSAGRPDQRRHGRDVLHSWQYLVEASKYATMMQVSTPELSKVYGKYRPTHVVRNYLTDSYYATSEHIDSSVVGWPASIHSHPNDPQVTGNALRRLMADGEHFTVLAEPQESAVERAFGLQYPPSYLGAVPLDEWPEKINKLGIGIIPLANSKFNRSKSWLKGLELAAVGVPWVASPRAEYHALHALGCGLLAHNPGEWYRMLSRLCKSPAQRQDLSEAGKSVAHTLRLEDHAWRFWEGWSEAYKLARR